MNPHTISYLSKIDQLFVQYLAAYPEEADRLTVLASQLATGDEKLNDRKNMIGHLTASALVMDSQNRCLLIYHRFLKRWLQPGGHLEAGELPESGALRELEEETGLTDVTRLTDVTGTIDLKTCDLKATERNAFDLKTSDLKATERNAFDLKTSDLKATELNATYRAQALSRMSAGAGPLDIDSHSIPDSPTKEEGEHLHHDFQYIFRMQKESVIKLAQSEVSEYKWAPLDALRSGAYGQRLARVAGKIIAEKI